VHARVRATGSQIASRTLFEFVQKVFSAWFLQYNEQRTMTGQSGEVPAVLIPGKRQHLRDLERLVVTLLSCVLFLRT
jgi:hypothetical protein